MALPGGQRGWPAALGEPLPRRARIGGGACPAPWSPVPDRKRH
jgi:hypothetical protein